MQQETSNFLAAAIKLARKWAAPKRRATPVMPVGRSVQHLPGSCSRDRPSCIPRSSGGRFARSLAAA